MKKYGYFSGNEFKITDYNTPRPQLNYVWNDRILSGINHFGGGVGAYGNRAASYIDPEGKSRAILIRDGNRYFYIRDEETNEFWNPGWYPVKADIENYCCTHGVGYTKIGSEKNKIKAEIMGFVGEDKPAELWEVKLTNNSDEEKTVKVYSFIEFSLEGYARYSEYDSYVSAQYFEDSNMVYAKNTAQERPHNFFDGYIASDKKPSGFDSSKKAFLGTYGSIFSPEAVETGKCKNSLAACELMVGVLEHTITLKPNESENIKVVIGSCDCEEYAKETAKYLLSDGMYEKQLEAVKKSKQKMFDKIFIKTPVEKIDMITNYWVKNQVQLCCEAGRATGKGFRDQLQDSWGIAAFNSELAKEKIKETLSHQYSDGRCVRGWLPLDHHIYSDGPVWIAPTINAYIKETGDFAFLDEVVPYLDGKEATVWEHILLSCRYSTEDLGEHNLILAHDGDWNDSLNGIGVNGKGESVWTSIAMCYALKNTAEMAENIKKDENIKNEMLLRYEKLSKNINDNGWDGDWYLAGYDDFGNKVGTKTEKEGFIYLNSQTWAILAGICDNDKEKKCMESVEKYLDSKYGPLTLYPAYNSYNKNIGRLTGFVPGIWENSTPYCHGGTFKIVSDCLLKKGNKALETLLKIMPDSETNPSSFSGCEPYVFTNMYFGPENPRAGETAFAWVTGTAGWMFRAVTQYMLGFYPEYNSFKMNPCLPSDWEECSLTRKFRNDTYNITIKNPNHKESGITEIIVDGEIQKDNEVKLFNDGEIHNITVVM